MREVIQKNLKLLVLTLIIILVSGFFVIMRSPGSTNALSNGDNAVDVFGQTLEEGTSWTGVSHNGGTTAVSLNDAKDVVLDEINHLMYVADADNHRVVVYNLEADNTLSDLTADYVLGQSTFTSADNPSASEYAMRTPEGLALDVSATSNRLFVSDSTWHRVLVYDFYNGDALSSGRAADNALGQENFGATDSGTNEYDFANPMGMDYDQTNDLLYVADFNNNRVMVFTGDANLTNTMRPAATYALGGVTDFSTAGTTTCDAYSMQYPRDVDVDEDNGHVYVTDENHYRVLLYDYAQGGDKALSVPGVTTSGIEAHYVLGQANLITCTMDEFENELRIASGIDDMVFVGSSFTTSYFYDLSSYTLGVEEEYDYVDFAFNGMTFNETAGQIFATQSSSHRGVVFSASIFNGSYGDTDNYLYDDIVTGWGRVDDNGDFYQAGVNEINNGPNSFGFLNPGSVAYDGDENWLYVADEGHDRIMVFDLDDSGDDYYLADKVVGSSNIFDANQQTITASEYTLSRPMGMDVGTYDGIKYLFVADNEFNRVLLYDITTDGLYGGQEPAAYVLGQSDFSSTTAATSQSGMNSPVDVVFDDTRDALYVVDEGNNRVLFYDFNVSGLSDGRMADYVFGQDDFLSTASGYAANRFVQPKAIDIDETDNILYVSDSDRVVIYDLSGGISSGMNASNVFGSSDLTTSPNGTTTAYDFDTAFTGLAFNNDRLYVSDGDNNRVLIFNVEEIANYEAAQNVIGQDGFTSSDTGSQISRFNGQRGIAVSPDDSYLFAADYTQHRVLVFDVSEGPTAPTSCSIDSYTGSTATLSWTDNSSNEDYFVIESSTDETVWSTSGTANSNVTSGTASGLSGGQTYYFRVSATNDDGDSDTASCGSATLPANNAPNNLTVDTPTNSSTDVPLTGQEFVFLSSDSDGDRFYYRFELSVDEDFLTTLKYWDQRDSMKGWPEPYYEGTPDYTTFTLPDDYPLTPGTTYYWRARAFDEYGIPSDYSDMDGDYMSFTTAESSAIEDEDVSYISRFNGGVFSSASTLQISPGVNTVKMPANTNFPTATSALGEGGTYEIELFDADSDGDLDVLVGNGWEEGDTTKVWFNDGSGSFTEGTDEINHSGSYGIYDMDYDGDLDIVTANYVYFNDGSGDFSSSRQFNNSDGYRAMLGDFNKDGYEDIFILAGNTVANKIFLNNGGDETFTEVSVQLGGVGSNAYNALVDDWNGDGYDDVIVLNNGGDSYHDSDLYLNNRDMTFEQSFLLSTVESMESAESVDLDNDGDKDLLIGDRGVYWNDGAANFTDDEDALYGGSDGVAYTAADIDGDGDLDVLGTTEYGYDDRDGQNYMYINMGGGEFARADELGDGATNTGSIAAGDLDGDGDIDIIEGNGGVGWNQTQEQNYIYFNVGSFDYDEQEWLDDGSFTTLAIFDADNDGDNDMWANTDSSDYRAIRLADGNGGFETVYIGDANSDSVDVITVDLNNDGYLDVVEAADDNEGSSYGLLWMNDGAGSFTLSEESFESAQWEYWVDVDAADFDGDGYQDLLFGAMTPDDSALYTNDGDGTYTEVTLSLEADMDEPLVSIGSGDVDNDGDVDIIVPYSLETLIYLNDGDANFTEGTQDLGLSGVVEVGDMDNDGDLDIVNFESGPAANDPGVWLNVNGTFEGPVAIDDGYASSLGGSCGDCIDHLKLVDLDNDGDLDIYFSIRGLNTDRIYRNYGRLSFVKETGWFSSNSATRGGIVFGDYDSDGDIDFFTRPDNEEEDDESEYLYENKQLRETGEDFELISGPIDSTEDNIYTATLTVSTDAKAPYTMTRIPFSYDGTDYSDAFGSGDEDANGLIIFDGDDSLPVAVRGAGGGMTAVIENNTDITNSLSQIDFADLNLALVTFSGDFGDGPFTMYMTAYASAEDFPDIQAFEDYMAVFDPYGATTSLDFFAEDVFTYDSETGEYTYNAPTGVSLINTWQSGDPEINPSSLADNIGLYLYNGTSGGGGDEAEEEWSFEPEDVDTGDVVITGNINDMLAMDADEGDYIMVVGDNNLVAYTYAGSPWAEISVPANMNSVTQDDYITFIAGDDGYAYAFNDGPTPTQLCHTGGVPDYSDNFNAIDSYESGSEAYAVGDNGLIVHIDYSDWEAVVCTDVSVTGVTANLNDLDYNEESDNVIIVGDSGTVIGNMDSEDLEDYTSLYGITENLNTFNFDGDDAYIGGDNGYGGFIGDGELEEVDFFDNDYDIYDAFIEDDDDGLVMVAGSGGESYFITDDLSDALDWDTLSSIYGQGIIDNDHDQEITVYAVGSDGLFKSETISYDSIMSFLGVGGGDFDPEDVDTGDLEITGTINDVLAFEVSEGGEIVFVVGDDSLLAAKIGDEDWVSFSVGADMNDMDIDDGIVFAGDNGYLYGMDDEGLVQLCHVGGVPNYNYNFNSIAFYDEGDLVYAAGDNGKIVEVDVSDLDNIACTEKTVDGVTENLNAIDIYPGTSAAVIVGDNGTILANGESEDFADFTNDFEITKNLNSLSYAGDMLFIAGDEGGFYVMEEGDEDFMDFSSYFSEEENLNHLAVTMVDEEDGLISIVGTSGTHYMFAGGEEAEEFYWETVSELTASSTIYDDEYGSGETYVVGVNGLLKHSEWSINDFDSLSGGGAQVDFDDPEDNDWVEVQNGVPYEFSSGASDLRYMIKMYADSDYDDINVYDVNISYSTTPTADPPPPPVPIPSAPNAERPDIVSSSSIQWNFADTADNEVGFRLYDESNVLLSDIVIPDQGYIVETGLDANTAYTRSISAYNADGESALTELGTVYTLANVPSVENLVMSGSDSVSLTIDEEENPNETKYSIYESGTQSWLQTDYTLGEVRSFKTYSDWLNGESGIILAGLTDNAMYCFTIIAENGDNTRTEFSDESCIIVHEPVEANILLSKKVGVNLEEELVGVYFGKPVMAGTTTAERLKIVPLLENLANVYIALTCFLMVLCLFLVLMNAAPCCRPMKHAHRLLLTDWRGRKADVFYHMLHGEDANRAGKKYARHRNFYRFTNWGAIGVFFGIVAKVGVVLITALIVYGTVQVQAFENESGADVVPGDVLTYQVTYSNNGDETATNVVISDFLPREVEYVEGSLMNGDECVYDAGQILCVYEEVAGDVEGTIEFKAVVPGGTVGDMLSNLATATFAEGDDSVSSNSVTNEVISGEEPTDCGEGEVCQVALGEGWNYFRMAVGATVSFPHEGESHSVTLNSANTTTNRVGITVASDPIDFDLGADETGTADTDGNGLYDLLVKNGGLESDTVALIGVKQETESVDDTCGNGTCDEGDGESCDNCPDDCGACAETTCGNGICQEEEGETCDTCSDDCGVCPVPDPICGDDICNGSETCSTCVADCGACPVPPVCGDGTCEGGENCSNCSSDCGACITGGDEDSGDSGNGNGTHVPACSDGIDNDGDDKIDLADPGCENALDDSEWNLVLLDEEDKEEIEEEVEELLEEESTIKIVDSVSSIVSGVTQQDYEVVKEEVKEQFKVVATSAKKATRATIDNPAIEYANEVVQEPVVATATAASVAAVATVGFTGATGASLLTYLQFLFTQPFLLITRRRKRGWGVVYNSLTKQPIDLAIVRLYDADTKKLVRTRVTDRMGRYQFIVKPGMYYVEVDKKEYEFPCNLLDHKEKDGEYTSVYYGSPIKVSEEGVVNMPIPLDPNKKLESDKNILRKLSWKKVQGLFTLLGPILAIVSFIITPETWIAALIAIQLVLYFVFKRLADAEKPISWGMVKDALTGKSLKKSVVRVFDKKFNKLLDTQVTNNEGKYAFLVGKNQYYITSEKDGYQPHKTPVYDMTGEDLGYLAKDIKMAKEGQQSGQGDGDDAVAVQSNLGRQEEVEEGGVKKVARPRDEKFQGDIKDVDLEEMHEDYYDVDVLKKD